MVPVHGVRQHPIKKTKSLFWRTAAGFPTTVVKGATSFCNDSAHSNDGPFADCYRTALRTVSNHRPCSDVSAVVDYYVSVAVHFRSKRNKIANDAIVGNV